MSALNHLSQLTSELLTNLRVAAGVATITVSSGVATFIEWVPLDLGKIATLVGIVLSAVLIVTHIRKAQRDAERHEIEIALLRMKLASACKEEEE